MKNYSDRKRDAAKRQVEVHTGLRTESNKGLGNCRRTQNHKPKLRGFGASHPFPSPRGACVPHALGRRFSLPRSLCRTSSCYLSPHPLFVPETLGCHQTTRAICARWKVGTHRIMAGQEVAGPDEMTPAVTGET